MTDADPLTPIEQHAAGPVWASRTDTHAVITADRGAINELLATARLPRAKNPAKVLTDRQHAHADDVLRVVADRCPRSSVLTLPPPLLAAVVRLYLLQDRPRAALLTWLQQQDAGHGVSRAVFYRFTSAIDQARKSVRGVGSAASIHGSPNASPTTPQAAAEQVAGYVLDQLKHERYRQRVMLLPEPDQVAAVSLLLFSETPTADLEGDPRLEQCGCRIGLHKLRRRVRLTYQLIYGILRAEDYPYEDRSCPQKLVDLTDYRLRCGLGFLSRFIRAGQLCRLADPIGRVPYGRLGLLAFTFTINPDASRSSLLKALNYELPEPVSMNTFRVFTGELLAAMMPPDLAASPTPNPNASATD